MTDLATGRSLSYQSGDWYGVVGPHVVVLLPPEEKARVAGIWTLADGGAGFDETLDALIADGLRALHGFVLVSGSEGDTKVVIRGEAHATFVAAGELVEIEGSAATTWVERSLREVTGMEVVVGDAPAGTPSYVMETGLVRVARISEGSVTVEEPEPTPEPQPEPEPYVEPEPEPEPAGPGLAVVGGAAAAGAPGVGAVPPPVATFGADVPDLPDVPDAPDEPDEPDEPAVPETPEVPAEPEEDDGAPTDIFSVVPAEPEVVAPIEVDPWIDPAGEVEPEPSFGSSFDLTPEPEPVPEPVPAPVPAADGWAPAAPELPDEPSSYDLDGADDEDVEDLYGPDAETGLMSAVDHDGETHLSPFDQDELALVRPGIAGQESAPEVTARPVARLVVSTGETVDVDRVVILGRAPSPRSDSSSEQPVLVRLPSPHQEISSTHVEVRPGSGADHGTAVVTDLGSTNGTIVVQPGLEPEELQPGVSVQLIPGAVIDLGDGVTIQVVRA